MGNIVNHHKMKEIANQINEHKGMNTIVLYVSKINSWTDYFIITTVRSKTHLSGLLRMLNTYFKENQIQINNPYKGDKENGWILIDGGDFVIHLMEKDKREFYELEKLWFESEIIYQGSEF